MREIGTRFASHRSNYEESELTGRNTAIDIPTRCWAIRLDA